MRTLKGNGGSTKMSFVILVGDADARLYPTGGNLEYVVEDRRSAMNVFDALTALLHRRSTIC
jgi:hypothetical protein